MYTFHLLDHCYADSFSGHHLPTVSVPTRGTMTGKEVCEVLEDEVNLFFEHLESAFKPEDIERALKQFKKDHDKNRIYISLPDFDKLDDEEMYRLNGEDLPCLFFTIGRGQSDLAARYVVVYP